MKEETMFKLPKDIISDSPSYLRFFKKGDEIIPVNITQVFHSARKPGQIVHTREGLLVILGTWFPYEHGPILVVYDYVTREIKTYENTANVPDGKVIGRIKL
ncbi:MAG: hypothetical protein WC858_03980 [Parcubacteria group bacterium]|jgi:hypothetical protein